MAATHLVDGYNLLHVAGFLHGMVGPHHLERARKKLLDVMVGAHEAQPHEALVVFDAVNPPPGSASTLTFGPVEVRFAVGRPSADDLIEDLIRQHPAPRKLVVVSDDHRVKQAARRAGCEAQGCVDYLEWALARRARPAKVVLPPQEKGELPGPDDVRRWLAEFSDVGEMPELHELSDDFGFGP